MNAIRGCVRQPIENERAGCLATICIGAALATGGEANCLAIAADAEAIRQDDARQIGLARKDDCPVPSSQIATYFE